MIKTGIIQALKKGYNILNITEIEVDLSGFIIRQGRYRNADFFFGVAYIKLVGKGANGDNSDQGKRYD